MMQVGNCLIQEELMFSPELLNQTQTTGETLQKPKPSPYDMDVVTGPSGPPKSKSDDSKDSSEGGGWLEGNMN